MASPQQQPQAPSTYPEEDATLAFHNVMNDPTRWVIKRGVPIFKPHERVDPNTKALIKVDPTKLQRIATNLQRMEKAGVPIRMTLGHTEPGKPETQQPPVCGYYRNARVAPFGPSQEPAVVVDEWLDPQYLPNRKNFPFRSAEYYDDSEQITGVALLTRDPWLDLGVVAYEKPRPGCTFYSRTSEISQPKHYHFLTGDAVMWPQGNQPVPPFAAVPGSVSGGAPQPQPVSYAQPDGYVPAPQQQQVPNPAQYGAQPQPMNYAGIGGGPGWSPQHTMPSMSRSPAQGRGDAVYSQYGYGAYANEPPSLSGGGMTGGMSGPMPGGMSGGMPPGMSGGGSEGDIMQFIHDGLSEIVAAIASHLGAGATGAAPQSPFPPTPNAGYARHGMSRGGMSGRMSGGMSSGGMSRGGSSGYSRDNPPQQMARTISGLPVGYQMELDKRDSQIRQLNDAMRVLFYEKDERDTQACVSEIQSLIHQGFHSVGEYELAELKRKTPDERAAYLQHIVTKYERVGIDHAPPVLGDPTPGPQDNGQNRPATQEEVHAALEMSKNDRRPGAYVQALNYIRTNGVNRLTQYGGFDHAPPADPFAASNNGGEWQPGADAPGGYEPSQNGNGQY